ncbi:hypothetical protein P7K49_014421 [Saguinus oedipus]|uniref:Transmembrane protein 203 n=1 Tax=Saguinus oedipus TaxID=9490 RepID=A0ABQ9VIQ6_SAGOE|nr:hypothetical protein P7K49_014421 [Saguinus oedipus]
MASKRGRCPRAASVQSRARAGRLVVNQGRGLGLAGTPTASRQRLHARARATGRGDAALGTLGRPRPALNGRNALLAPIFVHLLALLVFSVLLALRVDGLVPGLSWWNVFVPFFAADRLSTYFTTILSVRLFQEGEKWLLCLFWVLTVLTFELLLCQQLAEQPRELWFSLITSPVFILLQLLVIRACRVN